MSQAKIEESDSDLSESLTQVGIARIDDDGEFKQLSVTPAIRAAGFLEHYSLDVEGSEYESIREYLDDQDHDKDLDPSNPEVNTTPHPEAGTDCGLVADNVSVRIHPEVGSSGIIGGVLYQGENAFDGRANVRWRSVIEQGRGPWVGYRVSLTDEMIETLGGNPENAQGHPVRLFAGDRTIALASPRARVVEVESDIHVSDLFQTQKWEDFKSVVVEGKSPEKVAEERGMEQTNSYSEGSLTGRSEPKYYIRNNVKFVRYGLGADVDISGIPESAESIPNAPFSEDEVVEAFENGDEDSLTIGSDGNGGVELEDKVRVDEVAQFEIKNDIETGQTRTQVTPAAAVAGVTPDNLHNAVINVQPENDQDGLIPAALYTGDNANMRGENWRSITAPVGDIENDDRDPGIRVNLTDSMLEELGVNPDSPAGNDVTLYAGERVIVFGQPATTQLSIELDDPMDLLPDRAVEYYREVEEEGKTPGEVAEERGIQVGTVKTRVENAKEHLKMFED